MITKIDTKIPELESWGSIANLGSEVLEGDVQCMGHMVHGAPTDPVSCAFFGVTRGKFRMTYPFDEHATVVEGSVTLTDESTGIAHCCNDVEAHGGVNAEMFYVSIGCYDNTAYFLPVDGILRLDVFRVTSGFYFYDNQSVVLGGNNVQFQTVFPPVPVAYHISVMFQISRNRIFSGFSQSIMYCHSTIFFLSVQKYVFSALFLQK